MDKYSIAVLDVGKTNKKIMIYDENLKLVDSVFHAFDEYVENDIHYEDTQKAVEWFKQELKNCAKKHPIRAISITTHGATYMCCDEEGRLTLPVIAYTTEPGEEFHNNFYKEFGNPDDLQKVTATPQFSNFINCAKSIWYNKLNHPNEFDKTKHILFFPEYLGFLLTKKTAADPTYVGCHSYLWDFQKNKWSSVAKKMDIIDKLPEKLSMPWDVLGKITPETAQETGLSEDTIVTVGIHDSNSSLLPYLVKVRDEFVLNSTGTWCVLMHPTDRVEFNEDELGKVVFYNLSAFNKPVKTSIFLGGMEFDKYAGIFKKINKEEDFPSFDPDLYAKIIKKKELFILPGVLKGLGQFPQSTPRAIEKGKTFNLEEIEKEENIPEFFKDHNTAHAVLNISLAIQSKVALDRTGAVKGSSIFTEGGFRKNASYNSLLTALYPDSNISLTNLEEATAFGAAMLGKCAVEGTDPHDLTGMFEIEMKKVDSVTIDGFEEYIAKFIELI